MAIEYRGGLVCSVNVSNLEVSKRWYRDALGFDPVYQLPEYGWCELRSPVTGVTVGLQEAKSGFGEGGATMSFTVTDIEAARRHLEKMGTRLTGDIQVIPGDDGVKLAYFTDPDGNPLTLAEPNHPPRN